MEVAVLISQSILVMPCSFVIKLRMKRWL